MIGRCLGLENLRMDAKSQRKDAGRIFLALKTQTILQTTLALL